MEALGNEKNSLVGGSHLGHAKKVIESNLAENTNSFYITAGPKNKRWSIQGGRYFVEGSVVGDNGAEPDKRLDLSDFDQIIFIGQWIQPLKYLPRFQPISTALKHAILRRDDLFINLPGGNLMSPLCYFQKLPKESVFCFVIHGTEIMHCQLLS